MLYVHCTLMDESRQCLTCLLLLTPIMFPDGNHFTFQSLLFSVFAKLLFTHSTRISSAVIIVVLLLGVTDFYPKFTFVLSLGGDRLDVRQEQENLRFPQKTINRIMLNFGVNFNFYRSLFQVRTTFLSGVCVED